MLCFRYSTSETRPHLEGIATLLLLLLLSSSPPLSETRPHLEGIATSSLNFLNLFHLKVGNKTSFRRDCDYVFPIKRLDFNVSETRPHLEGIAT